MEMWFYTIENPKPRFIAIDSVTCSGTNIQFTNLSTPNTGLTYRWELGSANTTSSSKNTFYTFYNYSDIDTLVSVKLVTIAGGTGCIDSISKIIRIKPLPNPNFTLSDTILCFPKVLFTTNSSTQIPPINNTSYKWYVTPTGASILNDTSNSQTSIYFADNQSGTNNFYTITLRSQSNFGCVDSIQKLIRIPTRPRAIFTFNVDSACGPVNVTSSNQSMYSNTFQWSSIKIGPTIYSPSSFTTNILFPGHTGLVDSIYPIKLISTNSDGCTDTLLKPFRVFPNPITRFATSLDSGCAPLPIDFFNQSIIRKPAVYQWSFGDGVNLNTGLDTVIHTYFGSIYRDTTYTTRLITTSANGCKDTLTKPINVLSGAVANMHLDDTLICSNSSVPTKLKITNSSFGSVDTFYWDFGDGNLLTTTRDTSIFKPYPFEGTYRIILKAVNTCRTSYDTAFITVQVPPNVNFTKTDSVGCNPLVVNFTNLSTNTYKASFLWNYGNGNSSANYIPIEQTYLQSLTTDTFYYIRLNVSNFCGSFPKLDTVRVLPKPTAIFLTNTILGCSPLEIYLSNFSVGIPQNVKWYFGNGDSSIRFNLDYPFKPIIYRTIDTPTVYKIKLIVSNICGSDTMTKFITVLPNTVKSFFSSSAQNGCQSLTVNFKDLSYGGANISWNFGDGGTSSDSSPVHTFSTPGAYKVRQFVNNNCSYDTSSVIIYVYPKPRFTIGKVAGNICVNQPVQFVSNLQDSGYIVWHFGDGDSSIAYNPTHAYSSAGKKIFTATLTSNFNTCKSIQKDSLIVQAIPIVSIVADTNRGCLNRYFNLSAISNGNHYYAWDFGDSNFAVTKDVPYKFNKPGTYTLKLVATSILGCKDSAYKQIEVYPIPTALFDYTPKDTCSGPVWVNFTNQSKGANSYAWDFGNGNTSNVTNPRSYYAGIGKYKIQLTAENSYFCYDTITQDFEIFYKPEPDFSYNVDNICIHDTIKFTNQSKYSKTYFWDFGDGRTSNLENPSHKYDSAGTFTVKLVAFAGLVCADSIVKISSITIHPPPDTKFTIVIANDTKPYRIFKFSSNIKNNLKYDWYFERGDTRNGHTVFYTYGEMDTISCQNILLKVTSNFGCRDSSADTICIQPYWNGLFVPNAFIPDYLYDGPNVFLPIGIELSTYNVKVFNKWGELLWFSSKLDSYGRPLEGWNGNDLRGNPCTQGSYLWTIEAVFTDGSTWKGMEFSEGKFFTQGNVTLIR
jgi:PKD repeat protein